MAQSLRALRALASPLEAPGSIPSTRKSAFNCPQFPFQGIQHPSLLSVGTGCVHSAQMYTQRHLHTYNKIKKVKNGQ